MTEEVGETLEKPELTEVTNLALKLGAESRLPFVIVADQVYCVADRYQCKFGGQVPNHDAYYYYCPECLSRYRLVGQDYIDWCKFKEDGIIR